MGEAALDFERCEWLEFERHLDLRSGQYHLSDTLKAEPPSITDTSASQHFSVHLTLGGEARLGKFVIYRPATNLPGASRR